MKRINFFKELADIDIKFNTPDKHDIDELRYIIRNLRELHDLLNYIPDSVTIELDTTSFYLVNIYGEMSILRINYKPVERWIKDIYFDPGELPISFIQIYLNNLIVEFENQLNFLEQQVADSELDFLGRLQRMPIKD